MKSEMVDAVDLVWDLTRERLTVGGALVLRQEGEMLALRHGHSALAVHLICKVADRPAAERLAQTIFGTSIFSLHLIHSTQPADGWPPALVRSQSDFSYFSFARVIALHAESCLRPRLQWSKSLEALAQQERHKFPGRLFCVHLRSVAPFSPEESNANGPAWNDFFKAHADAGVCDFLLIGDDPLPAGLDLRPGVARAIDNQLGLATQLALIGISDGFLGMASGLCTAANFSETPHLIFKHPAHHAAEMARELGVSNSFSFAGNRQQLWRREANAATLDEAFHLITS